MHGQKMLDISRIIAAVMMWWWRGRWCKHHRHGDRLASGDHRRDGIRVNQAWNPRNWLRNGRRWDYNWSHQATSVIGCGPKPGRRDCFRSLGGRCTNWQEPSTYLYFGPKSFRHCILCCVRHIGRSWHELTGRIYNGSHSTRQVLTMTMR